MALQLKSVQLVNFQSWNDDSGTMDLDPGMLNVIKGRNETGKSVVFKVLYEMCFPGYHGSYLVRRGQEFGIAAFQMMDDTVIAFKLYRQGNRYYYILNPDGTHQEWCTTEIPDEIVQKMGLIISKPNRIILNVLDKDVPLPFVKTDPAYNASVLQSNLEPQELTEFFERTKEYIRKIQLAEGVTKQTLSFWEAKNRAVPYIDVEYIKTKRSTLSTLTPIYKACIDMYNLMIDLHELYNREPQRVDYDFERCDNNLQLFSQVNNCLTKLDLFSQLEIPPMPSVQDSDLVLSNTLLSVLNNTNKTLEYVYNLTNLREPELNKPIYLDNEFVVYSKVLAALSCIKNLLSIAPPVGVNDPKSIKWMLDTLLKVLKLKESLVNLATTEGNLLKSKQTVESLVSSIKDIESKLGICPLCGRRYTNE